MDQSQVLLDAFHRSRLRPPGDRAGAFRRLPEVGTLPSPWATWTLIELVLHHRRQAWARDLIRDRVHDQLLRFEGRPQAEGAVAGYVPGAPQWEYQIEVAYGYCTLSDRVTGELITAVLGPGEEGTSYFFADDLIPAWERFHPHAGGARLLRLHPSPTTMHLAIEELTGAGLLEEVRLDEETDFLAHRLATAVVAHAAEIEDFVAAWEYGDDRAWLAALIGDWMAAASEAIASPDPELMAITRARADGCRARRVTWLRRWLATGYSIAAHRALRDLGEDLPRDLSRAPRDDA